MALVVIFEFLFLFAWSIPALWPIMFFITVYFVLGFIADCGVGSRRRRRGW
jgi:hypothetical protein